MEETEPQRIPPGKEEQESRSAGGGPRGATGRLRRWPEVPVDRCNSFVEDEMQRPWRRIS